MAVTVFDGAVGKVLLDANNDDNAALKYFVVSSDNDGDKLPDEYELRKGLDPTRERRGEAILTAMAPPIWRSTLPAPTPPRSMKTATATAMPMPATCSLIIPEEWADADLTINMGDNAKTPMTITTMMGLRHRR